MFRNMGTQTTGEPMNRIFVIAIIVAALAFSSAAASAKTIYVNVANSADTTQDGSLSHPFGKIQQGINSATSGDTVNVAAGTYIENLDLNKSGITLQGTNRLSIIDGNQGIGIRCRNLDGTETTINGFYIKSSLRGIECNGTANLKIENNNIMRNLSETYGFGIFLDGNASAKIINNNLSHSAVCLFARDINKLEITGNDFYYCRGSYGAGIWLDDSNAIIKDNNMTENWDGSINIYWSDATIINTRINRSNSWGNSGCLNILDSNVEIFNSLCSNSHSFSSARGGGLYANSSDVSLYNNVFYGNSGSNSNNVHGAALYTYDTNVIAKNNIFSANYDANETIYISRNYFSGEIRRDFSYNDINNATPNATTGVVFGPGNIFSDPQFADTVNFYLKPTSPAKDSGDPSNDFNDNDGTRNDMGMRGGPFGDLLPAQIACYTNSDCGTSGWTGTASCSTNDVFQNYKTYACNNPGTTNAYCSDNTIFKQKQDCGITTYENWSSPYCDGNTIKKTRTAHNKGCNNGTCFANDTNETTTVQTCQYGCNNATCITPACFTDADCGINTWTGTTTCTNNDVFQNWLSYKCNNAGTAQANCTNSTAFKLKQDCGETTYGTWSAPYCNAAGNVEKSRTVHNKVCDSGACFASDTTEKQIVQECGYGCNTGECSAAPAGFSYYAITVDENDKPLPSEGFYYNNTGGDRGLLHAEDVNYNWDYDSAYTAKVVHKDAREYWTWGGMWYSLTKINRDNIPLDFNAIFGNYVKPQYQGQIAEIEVNVNGVASQSNNNDLNLKLELKNNTGNIICAKNWHLMPSDNPAKYSWVLPEQCRKRVKLLLWLIDGAQPGDSITVDSVRMKARIPDSANLPVKEQAFLWTYSWLMANYDDINGIVQDRSNFGTGDFESITATAKTTKIAYYAYKKGYTSFEDAKAVITKITDTLINKVPRGPQGKNNLLPHFTRKGGFEALPPHDGYLGTEWSSGDSSYAALDVIAALQMIGDPENQISSLIAFLQNIDWNAMLLENGSIAHGYSFEGEPIPYSWSGFGMETIGVNWAYASATGKLAEMEAPPSDNGSGFIDNVAYPLVFSGKDRWGNDWDAYRSNMADKQITWYCQNGNQYLCNANLFGLSAAETPEADSYAAYGIGGKYSVPLDGNNETIVLHYSGMISDIRPAVSERMWETLRDSNASFLQNKVVVSPLNNMESMKVSKQDGKTKIKYMKGSWNLALQAEGWALSDPAIRNSLQSAVTGNAFLKKGYNILKEGIPIQCFTNTDCGDNNWFDSPFCQDGNVLQFFNAFTCNNPGTQQAYCSQAAAPQIKQDCGNTTTGEWSANSCSADGNVIKSRIVQNRGCSNSTCTLSETTETQLVEQCENGCSNGECITNISCNTNSDCGTDVWIDSQFCQSGSVYQNYKTFTCNNAGTQQASCSSNITAELRESCQNGCDNGNCKSQETTNRIWTFSNFKNYYKVYNTATCDVYGIAQCPSELGWQGNSIRFRFPLENTEQLTDLLKFGFDVGYFISPVLVDIYAGSSLEKVAQGIRVNGTGTFSAEIPKEVFAIGTNYVQITARGVSVGYGQPSQAFVLSKVWLETDKNYVKLLLNCPIEPLSDENAFYWEKGTIDTVRLQFSYYNDFRTIGANIIDKNSPTPIANKYKKLIKLEKLTPTKKLYARLKDNNTTQKSNTCEFTLKQPTAPKLECPIIPIDSNYSFTWNPNDYNKKVFLEFSYEQSFAHKKRMNITNANPTAIESQWTIIESYATINQNKEVYARIYAIDKYNRKTNSNICAFTVG